MQYLCYNNSMMQSFTSFFKRPGVRSFLKKAIPILFYTLLIIFLYFYIQSIDFTKLQDLTFSWTFLIIATGLALFFRFWGTFIWFVLLQSLGAKGLGAQKITLLYVYAKSWLGRYIPGTAPWILGKIYFASQHGISKNKLAVSSLLEGALQIVVVMGLAFIFLILDPRLDVIEPLYKWLIFGIIVACFVAMVPKVFNAFISFAYKLIRKKKLDKEHLATSKTILMGGGLYTFGAILSGLSFFFIAKAFYPELPYSDIFFVMGATNLAAAASMLAVFAPSGIGVREGIQLLLLSLVMPPEIALIITVVTRLWGVAVDFLFFGIAAAIRSITHRRS